MKLVLSLLVVTFIQIQLSESLLRYHIADGNLYYMSDKTQTWYQALRQCSQKGMKLISLETQEEFTMLAYLMRETGVGHCWTSGTDLGEEGHFFWFSNGHPFSSFTKWVPGHPNNAGNKEHCVHCDVNVWDDIDCITPRFFACKIDLITYSKKLIQAKYPSMDKMDDRIGNISDNLIQ